MQGKSEAVLQARIAHSIEWHSHADSCSLIGGDVFKKFAAEALGLSDIDFGSVFEKYMHA